MFVRIDGAEASLKETRLFHAFPPLTSHSSCSGSVTDPIEATRPEPVVVHMVITWKEMSLTASGNDDGTFASLPHRNKGMHSGTSSIPQAHCRPLGTTGASGTINLVKLNQHCVQCSIILSKHNWTNAYRSDIPVVTIFTFSNLISFVLFLIVFFVYSVIIIILLGFTRNIMRTATDLSEMMTQVNEKYNVPQYYTLIFTPIS